MPCASFVPLKTKCIPLPYRRERPNLNFQYRPDRPVCIPACQLRVVPFRYIESSSHFSPRVRSGKSDPDHHHGSFLRLSADCLRFGSLSGCCVPIGVRSFCYTDDCREWIGFVRYFPARDKGKLPERAGRKAKGPNQERTMFQGQPSRHNRIRIADDWRASSLLDLLPLPLRHAHSPCGSMGGAV